MAIKTTNTEIKLIIAIAELLFRDGLVALIRQKRDFHILATVGDGEEAITLCKNLYPDVLLTSGTMPKTDTIEVVKEVRKACSSTAILVIADSWHRYNVSSFTEAGANGLVMKNISGSELVDVIRVIYAGYTVVGKEDELTPNTTSFNEDSITSLLHKREREVLRLASSGMTNKQIATNLYISEHTVSTHFFNIYRKLGVNTRLEATMVALKDGLYSTSELVSEIEHNK